MRRYREDSERVVRIGNHWVRRPQAYRVGPEPVTAREIAGLVLFVLFMYGAIIYALPIVLMGVAA